MVTKGVSSGPDFVVIGHLSLDRVDGEERLGGTVLYSGVTAARLGRRVGIVTALQGGPPAELDGMMVAGVRSEQTTSFELRATPKGRSLRLLSRAAALDKASIPESWTRAPLVHLAPIVNEVPPQLGDHFPVAQVLATPQGWLRQWDQQGHISSIPPGRTALADISVDALVLSLEDLEGDRSPVDGLAKQVSVLVLTEGERGCWVHANDQKRWVASFPVQSVDATGAGDVFAAAFFVRYAETGTPWEAAGFASVAAALSVSGPGVSQIPGRAEVLAQLESWLNRP